MDMFGDGAGEVGHDRAVARGGRSVGDRRAILRRTGSEAADELRGRGRDRSAHKRVLRGS
jgi:hypothetical protein